MEFNNEIILKSLFYNKTTTATEKIRMIKDKFKLSLRDLAGNGLSVPCVSNIIGGKQGITEYSGLILVSNINLVLNVDISLEWLLEAPFEQTNRLLEFNLESYKKGQICLEMLEDITKENTSHADTNLLLRVYEVLAEDYKSINVNKSLMYIDRGIEVSFKVCNFEKEINFKKLKGNIVLLQSNAQYALEIYKEVRERATDKIMKYNVHYNIIICLRKLEMFEEMFEEMDSFIHKFEVPEEDMRNLKLMEANSLSVLKEYDKALELYQELLIENIKLNNTMEICILNYNIADICYEKGDLDLAKKYINLRLEQKSNVYIVKHLLFAATIYNDLTYVQEAKKYIVEGDLNSLNSIYNKELELSIKNSDVETLKTCLERCIEKHVKIKRQSTLYSFMLDNFEKEVIKTYLELLEKNNCF